MKKPKIGLLPLYLELYDKTMPELRNRIDGFRNEIIQQLEKRNLDVTAAPVCRLKREFSEAVKSFEEEKVDAIVTVHLAYSPSLESIDALSATRLPIIILDTTPTYNFGPCQDVEEIMYNHGIHGVQDMCNLLLRRGKKFFLEAGHWEKSYVIERVANCARAVKLANCMRNSRVGIMGKPFDGMGDFNVPYEKMRSSIGIETVVLDMTKAALLVNNVSEDEVKKEMEYDRSAFIMDGVTDDIHRKSTVAGLAVRNWVNNEKLTAFTINFLSITKTSGIPAMPFLEASKAMAAGIGYAGEGDVLTAALVGALVSVYPDTSFTEMFCPDWEGNSIFLSHMGEMNINLAAEKPRLVEKDFPYTDADNPAVAHSRFREGKAVLVNLAPGPDDSYSLIVSEVEMLKVDGKDNMSDSIHGWLRPCTSVADFLKKYSLAGGTHHAAVVYGDVIDGMETFGKLMGWKVVKIS